MSDQTFTYDTQAGWETGELSGLVALDPPGKLRPGFDTKSVAEFVDEGALAVYCRCRAGAGTVIENVGLAGNGTFSGGSWTTRIDGRRHLTGGQVTIPFHASMAIADDQGDRFNQAGGLLLKLSSYSAQILMERSNRFRLGLLSTGVPYAEYLAGTTWHRATALHPIGLNTWVGLGFIASGGSIMLTVDNRLVARKSGFDTQADPSTDLIVRCSGDWEHFFLFGDATNGNTILNQPTSGRWVRKESAATSRTLRYLEAWTAIKDVEHSVSLTIRFSDSVGDLPYVAGWNFSLKDGYNRLYPPARGLILGKEMEVGLSVSARNWQRPLPLIDKLVIHTRDPVFPIIDPFVEDEIGYETVERRELAIPEDLSGALAEIRRLQANIIEIERRQRDFGGFVGSWPARRRRIVEEAELTYEERIQLFLAQRWQPTADHIRILYGRTEALATQIGFHSRQSSGIHGVGTSNVASQADIDAHAAATSGIHGVGASHVESRARLDIHRNTVNTHGVTHIAGVVEDIDPHIAATTGIHGVGTSTVASQADIDAHAADHTTHGTGTSAIASMADIANHNADGAAHTGMGGSLDAHSSATSGIHGVGTSNVASQADIDAHAADNTTHGTGASPIASEAFAMHEVHMHSMRPSGIHGVGASDVASQADIDAHQTRCTNYAI